MGEFAYYNSSRIKIGTCEDMPYLRADQVHLIRAAENSVDPRTNPHGIRFRFPFPSEDEVKPGAFDDPFYALGVSGVEPPAGGEHYPIQFRNDRGLLVSLPCPESGTPFPYKIHYNGYAGKVRIAQQRLLGGKLMLVCECGSCGAKWRCETLEDAEPVIAALNQNHAEIARRIRAGYTEPNYWTGKISQKE